MRRRPSLPARKQPTTPEILESLLSILESKFYRGYAVNFAKDRRRLLDWVILWPAQWLNERSVTVSADRYREILKAILIDAAAHAQLDKINYLPAYLAKTIQAHFAHHGDEIYEEAKAIRNMVENAISIAGRQPQAAPDIAQELTKAKHLLRAARGQTKLKKTAVKEQLSLL